MAFGDVELEKIICAGAVTPDSVCLWARSKLAGVHEIELTHVRDGSPAALAELTLCPDATDGTGARTVRGLQPGTEYAVQLRHEGHAVATARFETPPADRASAPNKWTFAAFSCHQPFTDDGEVGDEARSMLTATRRAFRDERVRFALMMGDQAYADLPGPYSLFDGDHFATVAPRGRPGSRWPWRPALKSATRADSSR
jgi:phosphodiesterase/alkaline phosphatase D-like protein